MSMHVGITDPRSADPRRRRLLLGLLVPADPDRAVTLCRVPDLITAISDTLGAHLLDDVTVPLPDGDLICLYRSEDYARLPDNPRLATVLARLAVTDRQFQAALRGDALVLGITGIGAVVDLDVPGHLVTTCVRCGIPVIAPT
jgi:hypothetical protein